MYGGGGPPNLPQVCEFARSSHRPQERLILVVTSLVPPGVQMRTRGRNAQDPTREHPVREGGTSLGQSRFPAASLEMTDRKVPRFWCPEQGCPTSWLPWVTLEEDVSRAPRRTHQNTDER